MKKLSKIYTGLVFLFLYAPIFVLIAYSFNESKSRSKWTGFTFDWYVKLFNNDEIIQALLNTLLIAVISCIAATVLGTAAAIGIDKMNKRMRSAVVNVTYLPILNPEIVTGVSLMLLFTFLKIEFGYTTLILAHISFGVPYVIFNVLPKLKQMDKYIYDAALDLGCSPFKAFWKVVVPEISPGIVSGALMAFTYSLDDFVISYFTSGVESQTLPIKIFSMTRRKVSPEVNALSTIIFLVTLTVLLIIYLKDSKKEKMTKVKKRGEAI